MTSAKSSKSVQSKRTRRLIVGISGASGIIYGVRLLEVLRKTDVETHLVISHSAEITVAHETDMKISAVKALADVTYANTDIAAAISSGSFKTDGMVIAPCSIRTAAEIATGVTSTLLSRAADVVLKERRRLVLMVRESPLHVGHLRTLTQLAEMGAIVAPPVPAFYGRPTSIDDIVDHAVGRVLDLFDMEVGLVRRWGEARSDDAHMVRPSPRRAPKGRGGGR
ncbi:MAG: UbiX family flavin prenyltransferase [Rhodospirillaceae bacterium]|nr:MAG: UbiX family flavin prenyltransferase [Rhodospirillaceae bacterium]